MSGQERNRERTRSAWGAQVLPLLPGNIKVENLGGGYYQLNFPAIPQVVGAVTTTHYIPFPHRVLSMYIKHTDSASVDESTDTLTFAAKFGLRLEVDFFSMATFSLSTNPDEAFLFHGDEATRNACNYEFTTTDVDAGNLVYITVILQALGGI